MVIISAAICTKAGKLLVSRQYTNISKLSIEEYVRSFPKSISATQQHTFVENEQIRYIYLPLETMYLVLVTNKNSNVIEDLETIRLVHKVVIEICNSGVSESAVQTNAFEILLAFDDVISFGYRENVTASQIQSALTMDSSDEKLHLMLIRARENEAKENAKRAQQEMYKKQKDPNYKPEGFSSESGFGSKKSDQEVIVNEPKPTATIEKEAPKGPVKSAPKSGLQILKNKEPKAAPQIPKKEEIKQLIQEEPPKHEYNPLMAPVLLECEEKVVCTFEKDGGMQNFEVKGDVFLTVRDPSKGCCMVVLETENNKAIALKPNPNLNRQFWSEKQALAPKEIKDAFAINQKINCVKYRYATNNASEVPFNFNYWFNQGSITCELEYNGSAAKKFPSLEDVSVYINFPVGENPEVSNVENGDFEINKGSSWIRWIAKRLDNSISNSVIEIKFSAGVTVDELFPFSVDFRLNYNYYSISAKSAATLADGTPMQCEVVKSFGVEKFEIQ